MTLESLTENFVEKSKKLFFIKLPTLVSRKSQICWNFFFIIYSLAVQNFRYRILFLNSRLVFIDIQRRRLQYLWKLRRLKRKCLTCLLIRWNNMNWVGWAVIVLSYFICFWLTRINIWLDMLPWRCLSLVEFVIWKTVYFIVTTLLVRNRGNTAYNLIALVAFRVQDLPL